MSSHAPAMPRQARRSIDSKKLVRRVAGFAALAFITFYWIVPIATQRHVVYQMQRVGSNDSYSTLCQKAHPGFDRGAVQDCADTAARARGNPPAGELSLSAYVKIPE